MQRFLDAARFLAALLLTVGSLGVTAGRAEAAPDAPKHVLAGALGSMSIGVNWSPVSGAQGYRIYRLQDGSGLFHVATRTGESATAVIDSGLKASTAYSYVVTAYALDGESPLSAATSYSSATTLAPGSPRGIVVSVGDNVVTLSWNANPESNLAGYYIYRASASRTPGVRLNAAPVAALTYTDLTVSNYTNYYYRVAAVDASGQEGVLSPERWAKPEASPVAPVPHTRYTVQSQECRTCHYTHKARGSGLLVQTREVDVCYTCHNGSGSRFAVTRDFGGSYSSRHPVPATGVPGTMTCSNCHNPHLNYDAVDDQGKRLYPKLLEVRPGSVRRGNGICDACHGAGSVSIGGDHETAFASSSHNSATPNPPSGSEVKCLNCHSPHASPSARLQVYSEENACFQCHYPENPISASPDIWSRLHASPDPAARHDILLADQAQTGARMACTNCHNGHAVSAASQTIDPDRPAPGNRWTGTVSQLCRLCHDGSLPTEAQTAPYAPGVSSGNLVLRNIQQAYDSGINGNAPDQHGNGMAGASVPLDPDMGWQQGDVVSCEACHDPHASPNVWNLRSTVRSSDGTRQKEGLLVLKLPGGGADTRYFCNACHGPQNMGSGKPWPTNCMECHTHGSGRF